MLPSRTAILRRRHDFLQCGSERNRGTGNCEALVPCRRSGGKCHFACRNFEHLGEKPHQGGIRLALIWRGPHTHLENASAVREVLEETGITASLITKLADIRYVYVRSWGDRERVFKIVSFYLLRYVSGRIDDVTPEMRVEVRRALWLPLEEAPRKLAYNGERQVVRKAQEYLKSHPEV